MVLLIDNYDSFVFNLQRYFVRLGQAVLVMRNDDLRLAHVLTEACHGAFKPFASLGAEPSALVLSPGPKRPTDAGSCLELVQTFSCTMPILGVCLGHQVIYEAFGGQVVRAKMPVHGRASPMRLGTSRLFVGLPQGDGQAEVEFARYHSLIAQPESLPETLQVTAWSSDGQIMAVEHRSHATYGVQFHPESILSPHGYRLLANFLHISGLPTPAELPEVDGPTCSEDRLEELGTRSMGTVGRIDANQLAGYRIGATDGDNASASDVALACLPALGIR